jgi:hypothetical protein
MFILLQKYNMSVNLDKQMKMSRYQPYVYDK